MNRRLRLGKELLKDTGVIIAHIDENEVDNLYLLLCEIFEEKNDLGRIIWNKCNPKGDSKGVSILHETILCFAKNKEKFLSLNNVLERAKQNAEKIIAKAKSLHKKIGKNEIPSDVNDAISPFKYPENLKEQFKVQYDLELINKEFKKWLKVQGFSGGEAAYKFIDENGDAYRGFPLTWPSKGKKAPEKYFKPLLHPKTNKKCPVPERGWRNPPETMHKLREQGLLLFGPDEKKQPELKGLLKDNMSENTPSMFSYSGSDDDLFKSLKLDFEFAKPLWVAKYIIKSVHPSPRIVLDFFAGSGTTGHAVLELNNDDDVQGMQFILCTDNENEICADICYPRLKKVIKGYSDKDQNPVPALPANLKYYKTSFVEASPTDKNKHLLVQNSTELLCLRENAFDLVSDDSFLKVFKGESMHIGILFDEDEICRLQKVITDTPGFFNLYIFSLANDSYEDYFREYKKRVQICSIPEVILKVYREIFG
jgi:adenine-specific DNA-methyltransferase